jgi:hypothetical protein
VHASPRYQAQPQASWPALMGCHRQASDTRERRVHPRIWLRDETQKVRRARRSEGETGRKEADESLGLH